MGLLDSALNGLGIDKDTAGMLGMALLNRNSGNRQMNPLMMSYLMGNDGGGLLSPQINAQSQTNPGMAQNTNSVPGYVTSSPVTLPTDKQALLRQLQQQAQSAYPDNPNMQKVAITQAIQESGLMGKPSQLASKYNNLFGIKAPGTAGTVNMRTGEFLNGANTTVNAGFGRNNTMGDSFVQHAQLMKNQRDKNGNFIYAPVLGAKDPYQAFGALQKAGYATDPNYSRELSGVYDRYVAPLY